MNEQSEPPTNPEAARRFHRVPVEGSAKLYSGTAMWTTRVLDMSLRGVLVERPAGWTGTPGSRYRLDLRLEGGVVIGMGVELAHIIDDNLGFTCIKIDLNSFAQLKRLIELNLGNTESLGKQLSEFAE